MHHSGHRRMILDQDIFTGSLKDMFSVAMTAAETFTLEHLNAAQWERGKTQSVWVVYEGPDCEPFKCYTRFGKDKIVIANIIGTGPRGKTPAVRKGRMPKVIEAASSVARNLVVESVVSPELASWLTANEWNTDPDDKFSFFKTFDPS